MHYGIIAAGQGSRLTQGGIPTPKPLIQIGGQPMLGRLVDIMQQCRAQSVSVIVNKDMDDVNRYAQQLAMRYGNMRVLAASTPSSLHSFCHLAQGLDVDRLVVTTVDTVFSPEAFGRYVEACERAEDVNGLMGVTSYIDDESPLYVDVDPDDMTIRAFRDQSWPEAKYVSGGIYALDARALALLERCVAQGTHRMRNYQRSLLANGLRLKAYDMGDIVDVDRPGDIECANAMIAHWQKQ